MFKNYFWGILCLSFSIQAQTGGFELDPQFDTSQMSTKILANSSLSQAKLLDLENQHFTTFRFIQAWQELGSLDFENRFLTPKDLMAVRKNYILDDIIPIGVMISEFDYIKPTAFNERDVYLDNQLLKKRPGTANVFETAQIAAAAPLSERHKGFLTHFILDPKYIINTTNSDITAIEIDFNDSEGFKMVDLNNVISVPYQSEGVKQLQFRITLSNGDIFNTTSEINIRPAHTDVYNSGLNRSSNQILPITATNIVDLSQYGETTSDAGQGEYEIFMDTTDGILDKPIIVVDGFDPGDTRDIPGIYNLLNYVDPINGPQNLADFVRSEGFDVVILNAPQYVSNGSPIDGGGDYIERNAMVLVELIETINSQKVGSEELVIIGPSMGGLISRYALNYMENNNLDHQTRLWLSFDSPHLGANVPIGFQHQFNFLAFGLDLGGVFGNQNVVELQPLVEDLLKSNAARQLLVDHFESHLASGSNVNFDPALLNPDAHPFRDIFVNNINGLTPSGYPENTRNVSVINGSGIGNPYFAIGNSGPTVTNGYTVINNSFNVALLTNLNIFIRFTPAAGVTQQVSATSIVSFGSTIVSSSASSQSFSFTDGVDAAPGGLFDLSGLTEGTGGGTADDFLAAIQIDKFSFIPSVSALGMTVTNNEIDWFHNIDLGTPSGRAVLNETPFVNWFLPADNEPHLQLTQANVAFAIEEIIPSTLSNQDLVTNLFKLAHNPISQHLIFTSNSTYENAKIVIADMAGKVVLQLNNVAIENNTAFPININNGIYILRVENSSGLNHIQKVVVNQ
ncbi:T9SS type A sorting domain-containing protein [Paucihalobacter ruber]|uniref:T9SS type A sorting domain-containing protein n=1 Tax=Paucihalobacter ruber TaxID=2567861 RepID=A0A506PP81_9FLAO|nr:T9SS type A sorting domain-containing protein [Paucihalobacter ruber]TPV35706.1 T9SS type A sorting domain-containing protein [Paucihalobacter ruber]